MTTARQRAAITCIAAFALALTAFWPAAALALPFPDVDPSWARESIHRLVETGIASGYPDGTFRPEKAITRGEFAQMAAAAFPQGEPSARVFADAIDHPARRELAQLVERGALDAGADATVRPDDPITRAEAAHALIALMDLDPLPAWAAAADEPLFSDVGRDNPAFGAVQVAARLNLYPPFLRGQLWPQEALTRAEAAYMVDAARRLERHSGRLERIDEDRRVLWLSGSPQGQRSFPISELDVFTPEGRLPWTQLEGGPHLHVVANRFGRPLIAWAEPERRADGWRGTLREIAAVFLTPEQVRALLDGDWEEATEEAKVTLYQQLVARGLRPWEADALVSQDWGALQELGQARVAELIGDYLQVSPHLVSAIFHRDWAAARDHAQMEALERLLQARLFEPASGDPSPSGS